MPQVPCFLLLSHLKDGFRLTACVPSMAPVAEKLSDIWKPGFFTIWATQSSMDCSTCKTIGPHTYRYLNLSMTLNISSKI